ncbi:CDP-alcohol phosphatidyltransferase family protein [Microvirga tunisiensis]|uniref:CDP-alcohol phosphatidyltransferase family protein n=1 Tax=Pannonibacter tanglangensis TaxID=2750084 RepID=A0A7X5EYZ7_9HYPH|nr:CDP-alcohol phosphatidyltransferase family protein [Pannonibacter sp. XCT-53]NBN76717.1 CDP-alcohol phosphatidyltransferase family protein [Pannonibacter sp. XCT-53]
MAVHDPSLQQDERRDTTLRDLRRSALLVLGGLVALAVPAYAGAVEFLDLGRPVAIVATALLLAIFALVLRGLPAHGHDRFGPANAVTALRAVLVCLITAAVCLDALPQEGPAAWIMVALVVIALSLDGVDGLLARRLGQESDLGARFDMEVDALLILALSAAAFLLDKAGAWVLLIGLMRYGFVLAQYALPQLALPLPPSFRRKLVCVVQVGVLCLVLVPGLGAPLSTVLAALALALLAYSFAVDTLYLLRQPEARP